MNGAQSRRLNVPSVLLFALISLFVCSCGGDEPRVPQSLEDPGSKAAKSVLTGNPRYGTAEWSERSSDHPIEEKSSATSAESHAIRVIAKENRSYRYRLCPGTPSDFDPDGGWPADWNPTDEATQAEDVEQYPLLSDRNGRLAIDMVVGENHVCALLDNGAVRCWGWATFEQLAPAGRFVQITQNCGLRPDGSFECWGPGLGVAPMEPPADHFTQVASTHSRLCGLKPDGSAECCGREYLGGELESRPGPFSQIRLAPDFNCGLKTDGTIQCWGAYSLQTLATDGRFTDLAVGEWHVCGLAESGHVLCWGDEALSTPEPPAGQFVGIAAGSDLYCGLRIGGTVECWNANFTSELDTEPKPLKIGLGWLFICGLNEEGIVSCRGGGASDYGRPYQPEADTADIDMDLGSYWEDGGGCAIDNDGKAFCWQAPFADSEIPQGPFTQISVGNNYACALHEDQTVRCWGDGPHEDVLDGIEDRLHVVRERLDGPFVEVDVGPFQTCAVRSDGSVACWESANASRRDYPFYELPPHKYRQVSVSTEVCGTTIEGGIVCAGPSGTVFLELRLPTTQLSVSRTNGCALDVDGGVQCWPLVPKVPTLVWGQTRPPAGDFSNVSVGDYHSCGIRNDGSVSCWGLDNLGQASPPLGEFINVSVSDEISCGVRPTGEIECWGYDFNHNNPFRHSE